MAYCMYLRKSRQDQEAEALGQGETLSRHYGELTRFAHSLGISVKPEHVYRELVSGDSITERPLMQQLLREVQAGKWEGVFCRDVARLSRGDTMDQGYVALAFKSSGTRILTPDKIYDPTNDMDEEMFDFFLFMSRREYKAINRRLQAGREASVRSGNYVGAKRIYGYEVVRRTDAKGNTLNPIPKEAAIVRQVFSWHLHDNLTPYQIADKLNAMGIPNFAGTVWRRTGVYAMLKNPVYCGYVQWLKRETRKGVYDDVREVRRPRSSRYILTKGVHEPLVSEEDYQLTQRLLSSRQKGSSISPKRVMRNPLSGLLFCAECGYSMPRKVSATGEYYSCRTSGCSNHGTHVHVVIDAVLDVLRTWVIRYSPESVPAPEQKEKPDTIGSALELARSSLASTESQLNTAMDMLERGVYTIDTFLQRRDQLNAKLASIREQIATLENQSTQRTPEEIIRANIPQIKHVLDSWSSCTDAFEQNQLLRTVVSRITLQKSKVGNRATDSRDLITLTLYPASND